MLPRATRSAPKACAPGGLHVLPTDKLRMLPLGVVGMSKTSCAARCSRRSVKGVPRAPAEGEGGVARREDLTAAAAATLERSAGTVAQGTMAARERRRRSAKVSRGRRAGCARPARCGRRVRVQRDSNGLGTWASEARGSGPLPRAGFPESGEVSIPFDQISNRRPIDRRAHGAGRRKFWGRPAFGRKFAISEARSQAFSLFRGRVSKSNYVPHLY